MPYRSNVCGIYHLGPRTKGHWIPEPELQHWTDQEFEYSLRVLTAKRIAERSSVAVHLQRKVPILYEKIRQYLMKKELRTAIPQRWHRLQGVAHPSPLGPWDTEGMKIVKQNRLVNWEQYDCQCSGSATFSMWIWIQGFDDQNSKIYSWEKILTLF